MLQSLSEKQKEYIRESHHRWNIKHGATRSGKTYLDYYLIPLRITERRGLEGLNVILGNTKGTLQRNVIQPMQNIYGSVAISNIKQDNTCQIFGETVFCLGADKENSTDRLRGSSIKYCYGDEIATWRQGSFEMLKSRLDKEYSLFEGTTNPREPSHWLKQFLDSDADIFAQHYTIDDNPFLPDSVKQAMKYEYTGVFYDRYILGLWTLAEGLIYPHFKDAIDEPPEEEPEKICVSIDYGTQNPFAGLYWELHKGVWYASREYYYSGRDTNQQKTDTEYLEDLEQWLESDIEKTKLNGSKIRVIVDPSAASFIALLRKTSWAKVIPADNDVLNGVRETATAMKIGKIKFSDYLKNWKKEVEGYCWDEKSGEDRPMKVNDHCLTGDTLVETESGEVAIKDLVGTKGQLWSYNVETNEAELKPYRDCRMTQEFAEIYEIETDGGRIIRCTGNHPVLTQRGYVTAENLCLSDRIVDINIGGLQNG